jgi:hypothetical protein
VVVQLQELTQILTHEEEGEEPMRNSSMYLGRKKN